MNDTTFFRLFYIKRPFFSGTAHDFTGLIRGGNLGESDCALIKHRLIACVEARASEVALHIAPQHVATDARGGVGLEIAGLLPK